MVYLNSTIMFAQEIPQSFFFPFITSIVEHEIYMKQDLHRYGNWGICFTYATWFALRGLAAAGKTYHDCLAVRKAADFLLKLQLDDGGWGESYLSCLAKVNFDIFSSSCHP